MKKFLILFLLLFLFIFVSNYSYLKSARVPEIKSAWWCNLFPSYMLNNLDDSIHLNSSKTDISTAKKSSVQIKFKFMELFH